MKIYQHQLEDDEKRDARHELRFDHLEELLEQSDRVPLEAEEDAAQADEVSPRPDDPPAGQGRHVKVGVDGKVMKIYQAEEIPLSVIGDLVRGWSLKQLSGRWVVGSLVGGSRAEGQGNNPWYLTFRAPDDTIRVWRVYRGGRRKQEPTVRDITSDLSG